MRNLSISTAVSAKPAKAVKAARVISTKPGKAVAKPATPAADGKLAARTERQAVLDTHRSTVARFYNGASLTAHKHKACTFDNYAAVCSTPTHRCGPNGTSERDHSMLALLLANSKAGVFDPVALACDAGVISRLASVAFISYDSKAKTFALTALGTDRAKLVTRKAS